MKEKKVIILDDDEIDRLTLVSFVKRFPALNLIGVFSCPFLAQDFIKKEAIDILFLDIDMPGLSGVELMKSLDNIPVSIFVTSHPEFAVESFDLGVLDFLVKPATFDRFQKTMSRIEAFLEIKQKALLFESSIGGDVIYIKEGHEQTKVKLHEILYIEGLKDYSLIVTHQKRHCVLSSIGNLLKESNFSSFVRVHRSYAVQKQYVQKINTNEIILNNNTIIPIGRSFKPNLNLFS